MVFDVLRGYLHVASGLSDVTKQRARDLAEAIVSQGMDVTSKSQEQVQSLTDEFVESSRTNRELLTGLIRTEVDRTVSRMGFVREDELAAVRQHVNRLEVQLQKEHQRAAGKATEVVMGTAGTSTAAARSAVGAASKTVSGVAGVMASGAAKMAASASSATGPAEAGRTGNGPSETDLPDTETAGQESGAGTTTQPDTSRSAAGKQEQQKKAPATKTPTKKVSTKKSSSPKTGAVKQPAPKKATAKKAAARKAASKKPALKKATPKKATPKKAAAKKSAAKKKAGTKASKKPPAKKPQAPKPKGPGPEAGSSAAKGPDESGGKGDS